MDQEARDYLLRANEKVIAHYRQLLRTGPARPHEHERIQRGLAAAEADRATLLGTSARHAEAA